MIHAPSQCIRRLWLPTWPKPRCEDCGHLMLFNRVKWQAHLFFYRRYGSKILWRLFHRL